MHPSSQLRSFGAGRPSRWVEGGEESRDATGQVGHDAGGRLSRATYDVLRCRAELY